jgi:uncharacterized protein YjbI with pentapeptide repeats
MKGSLFLYLVQRKVPQLVEGERTMFGGTRSIPLVAVKLAVATLVVGLSIFATAGTSGATSSAGSANNKCVPRPDADLEGCDFAHQVLAKEDIEGANFTDADLDGTNLGQSNLDYANFTDANFTDARVTNVRLRSAKLVGANITGADLTGAFLVNLSSGGITGTAGALPHHWKLVDGYLIGPDANLRGADLDGANLTRADLKGAHLRGADLTGVTWDNTTCPDGTNSNNDGGTCANDLG